MGARSMIAPAMVASGKKKSRVPCILTKRSVVGFGETPPTIHWSKDTAEMCTELPV